jgi:hypothetical protein
VKAGSRWWSDTPDAVEFYIIRKSKCINSSFKPSTPRASSVLELLLQPLAHRFQRRSTIPSNPPRDLYIPWGREGDIRTSCSRISALLSGWFTPLPATSPATESTPCLSCFRKCSASSYYVGHRITSSPQHLLYLWFSEPVPLKTFSSNACCVSQDCHSILIRQLPHASTAASASISKCGRQ